MERITDKLKKLLALAERGYGGEAENARRLLEAQLNKYELTLEDLLNEGKKRRILKYRGEEELRLVIQVLASVLGSKNEVFNGSTYNSSKKQLERFEKENKTEKRYNGNHQSVLRPSFI